MHIYKWTHIDSNRVYIGQTTQDPNQRRLEHLCCARNESGGYHFHNALRKYGEESFAWEILAEAKSLDELNILEVKYINEYDSINTGFNLRQGGDNKLHSEESKKRMSEAQKKAHARRKALGTDTWTRKDGGPMKGKTCSDEHREKISNAAMGRNKNKTWKLIKGKRVWMEKE